MNLATRCTACGTVFRVVRDQLRVSEGWVRCGRCDAVFDAAETLFDIDLGEPVHIEGLAHGRLPQPAAEATRALDAWDVSAGPTPASAPAWAPPPADEPPQGGAIVVDDGPADGADPLADVVPADWEDHQRRRAAAEAAGGMAFAPHAAATGDGDTPLLRARASELVFGDGRDAADDRGGIGHREPPPAPGDIAGPGADEAPPSFVRAAERAAFWRRGPVRAVMALGSVVLAVGLVAQAALLWRDPLAAHVPALAPAVTALCRATGCAVRPLRHIELLTVDSSSLNRIEGSALYRLQLVLRNRAETALLMPALDLALTDNQGRLVARRVLQAADLGLAADRLERGQELPIRAVLTTGDKRIDGYTLELFYP